VAFFTFDAFAFFVTIVWEAADASSAWFHFFAFLWNDNSATDHVWQWGIATLHAVVLSSQIIFDVNFAISWAQDIVAIWSVIRKWHSNWFLAIGGWHAHSISMFQVSLFAEASNHAVLGADWARMWVVAGGWACSSAGFEYFIFLANWWHHHQVECVDFWALFFLDAFTIGIANMALFASTSLDTDAWTDWVFVCACGIASLASTEFFIFTGAQWILHGWNTAFFGWNTFTIFLLQESWFAETSDDALPGANWAWMWVGAGWSTSGTAWHEDFIFFALHIRRESEQHLFVLCLTVFRTYAFAFFIFHETRFTETAHDTLECTDCWVWIGARRFTSGSTAFEFTIWTAIRSNESSSKADGQEAEQQRGSKARVHR
jgi:hypothetical protein